MQLQLAAQMLEPQGMSLRYILTKFTPISAFFLNKWSILWKVKQLQADFRKQKSGIIRSR